MRCQEIRASKMIMLMKSLGVKAAEECSLEDACKLYARVLRGTSNSGVALPPAELQRRGRQGRRAKQTHRGKR